MCVRLSVIGTRLLGCGSARAALRSGGGRGDRDTDDRLVGLDDDVRRVFQLRIERCVVQINAIVHDRLQH